MPRLKNTGDLWKREKNNFHFSKEETEISYHSNHTLQTQLTFVAQSLLVFDCSFSVGMLVFVSKTNLCAQICARAFQLT